MAHRYASVRLSLFPLDGLTVTKDLYLNMRNGRTIRNVEVAMGIAKVVVSARLGLIELRE